MTYRSLKDGDLANPLSLGEFFEGLGGLMKLPPKSGEKPSPPRRIRRPGRLLLPALALAFAVSLTAFQRGHKSKTDALPPGLAGHWTTVATNYDNRGLEFLPDRVVFETGPDRADRTEHLITRVQSRQVGDTTLLILSYLEAGSSYDLAMKFTSVPELGIRFTNQDYLVWRPIAIPSH